MSWIVLPTMRTCVTFSTKNETSYIKCLRKNRVKFFLSILYTKTLIKKNDLEFSIIS